MQLISRYLRNAKSNISCHQFCIGASQVIARQYHKSDIQRLTEHPEERLTASCIVFSRLRREIWMVGDCQCLLAPLSTSAPTYSYYDNPKPYEQELAEKRAAIIQASKLPPDTFLTDDTARQAIIPRMLETMQEQNKSYAVVDGFVIPEQKVRILTLDFQPWEIILASDGYPFLEPTLEASEKRLADQRASDPLNIGAFKATKGFLTGNNSFDDRAYIRFRA